VLSTNFLSQYPTPRYRPPMHLSPRSTTFRVRFFFFSRKVFNPCLTIGGKPLYQSQPSVPFVPLSRTFLMPAYSLNHFFLLLPCSPAYKPAAQPLPSLVGFGDRLTNFLKVLRHPFPPPKDPFSFLNYGCISCCSTSNFLCQPTTAVPYLCSRSYVDLPPEFFSGTLPPPVFLTPEPIDNSIGFLSPRNALARRIFFQNLFHSLLFQ